MTAHADREHASWSASSTAANWSCAGRLAMTKDLPESTSEPADWGTACHQVAEKCLRAGTDADAYIGTTEKGKEHSFEVDDEMAETAQRYVDYCRGRIAEYVAATGEQPVYAIEQRFSLASLNPPFDAGGTGDFVIYFPKWGLLEVVDLKGGRGVVVEVIGNPQGRSYGLGAVLANPDWKVKRVMVTIVQPRAPHKDGRIRSEEFHLVDLLEWTVDLMAAMDRSAKALKHLPGPQIATSEAVDEETGEPFVRTIAVVPTEWASTYLTPGSGCTFCKAAGFCPALEKRALDQAGVWFTDEGAPQMANVPHPTDPAARRDRLDALELLETYVKAVRAWEHRQSEGGDLPTDYILVESFGREKFKDEAVVIDRLKTAGVPDKLYLNPAKTRTPKQIRDELTKKKNGMADKIALLADTTTTPSNGRTLVRADKTTRAAAVPAAKAFFADEGEATSSTGLFD